MDDHYARISYHKMHERIHTGVKPFYCTLVEDFIYHKSHRSMKSTLCVEHFSCLTRRKSCVAYSEVNSNSTTKHTDLYELAHTFTLALSVTIISHFPVITYCTKEQHGLTPTTCSP